MPLLIVMICVNILHYFNSFLFFSWITGLGSDELLQGFVAPIFIATAKPCKSSSDPRPVIHENKIKRKELKNDRMFNIKILKRE